MKIRCQPRSTYAAHTALHLLLTAALVGTAIQPVLAQTTKPGQASRTSAAGRKQRVPKRTDVTLSTKDGVELHCTYYPGPETKQTVPMILVHDWEGSGKDLDPLAVWMRDVLKLAVIVPDLRGHGESLRAKGGDQEIDRSNLKGKGIDAMMWDIEACKSFLLKRNNEGKVNIEQLGLLGSGFGAFLAIKWAVRDWSVRDLPTLKQGRDVKAVILVSPCRDFRGASADPELRNPRIWSRISTLTIVGREKSRSVREAKRVHRTFERAWKDESDQGAPFLAAPTPLQGTELLMARGTNVARWIAVFINRRLIQLGQKFPWMDRTNPLE